MNSKIKCHYLLLGFLLCIFSFSQTFADEVIFLRDNLKKASPGDFIVTAQDKNFTLLHINSKLAEQIIVEEIAIAAAKFMQLKISWKDWMAQGAPGNTSWVMYSIDLRNGAISDFYSVKRKAWCPVAQNDIFLSKLLNLKFFRIPDSDRKKAGPTPPAGSFIDKRPLWQPKMVYEGKEIKSVTFSAWRTDWPRDSSQLSGKHIEVFIPAENNLYPSYFPYWLQISGIVGKAKLRIVDAGKGMSSPAPSLPRRN